MVARKIKCNSSSKLFVKLYLRYFLAAKAANFTHNVVFSLSSVKNETSCGHEVHFTQTIAERLPGTVHAVLSILLLST